MKLTRNITKDAIMTTTALYSTTASNLYPFYILCSTHLVSPIGNGFLYEKLSVERIDNVIGRYDNLFSTLDNRLSMDRFEFKVSDEVYHLYVAKHFIMDKTGNIMFCMAFDDLSLMASSQNQFTDYRPFKLFVSTKFITEDIYKNIWKKIDKDYVSDCYFKGIRVEFTTSKLISESLFKSPVNLNFSNVSDMDRFTSKVKDIFNTSFLSQQIVYEEEDVIDSSDLIESDISSADFEELLIGPLPDYVMGFDPYNDSTSDGSSLGVNNGFVYDPDEGTATWLFTRDEDLSEEELLLEWQAISFEEDSSE